MKKIILLLIFASFNVAVLAKNDTLYVKNTDTININQLESQKEKKTNPLFIQILIQSFVQILGFYIIYKNTKLQIGTSNEILKNSQKNERKKSVIEALSELITEIRNADTTQLTKLSEGKTVSSKHSLSESKILLLLNIDNPNYSSSRTLLLKYKTNNLLSQKDIWLDSLISEFNQYIKNED